MKRLKYIFLLLLIISTTRLRGDIIIIEPTPAKICSRISNLKDFPELVVIGLMDCVALSKAKKAFRIKNNNCIKVHKSCPVSLYVTNLDYYKQIDLDNIDWDDDENVQKLNLTIEEKRFNSINYSSATIDFNLANYNDTVYYLYKTKLVYKYIYDSEKLRPDSVQYFEDNIDPFKPISVEFEDETIFGL